MRQRLVALTLTLACIQLALPAPAQAQTTSSEALELLELLRHDLTALGVNTPVFLSQRLPGVMMSSGIGAGSGLSDDSGGVTVGVLARVALFNDFKSVGNGMALVDDIRPKMPDLMPWPQLGVVVGVNLGDGVQLGADVQFLPETDIASGELSARASLLSIAATLRWRATKADGALPALVLGVGGSYYFGSFELGAGFSGTYEEEVQGQTASGTYSFRAAPAVDWSLFQVSPEVQIAWDIGGVFRPYIGLGLGLTFGTVSDQVNVRAELTVDEVNGQPRTERYVEDYEIVYFETEPALYTLRPHLGFDLVLGIVAITVQADLAVMGKTAIDTNLADAADSFDDLDDGDFLYADNKDGTQTSAALVLTTAVRLQF